jgi:alkylation response protein AidB-like acyl-CoA dehydrogenase
MDFSYPDEAEAFRTELRTWLDAHLPDDLRGRHLDLSGDDDQALSALRGWNRQLADAGYAAIEWPVEWGGRGAGVMELVVYAEELDRARAPGPINVIGLANIAPAIMQFGTDEQRRRLLPPMARGDEIWCQGFSEPDAGSDLASLATTAVRDGDHYVVTGRKVWNTLGSVADWCELLVRTDPSQPRHRGISCLLVDMSSPGIDVRPLVTITGERDFSELVFDDVRVPTDALLGDENDGWVVAMSTLANERAGVAALHLQVRRKIVELVDLARSTTRPDGRRAADDPAVRRRLAAAYVRGEHLKLVADRIVSGHLHGRPTGPESSIAKLVWSELEQELGLVVGEILGPVANTGGWGRDRLASRSLSIAGGTTQVNKNVVAQRVLGLPRA